MGNAKWFLGIKFNWSTAPMGMVHCHLSQETYANETVNSMGPWEASVTLTMTPYCSHFPIDTIPEVDISDSDHHLLIDKYHS